MCPAVLLAVGCYGSDNAAKSRELTEPALQRFRFSWIEFESQERPLAHVHPIRCWNERSNECRIRHCRGFR